METVPRFFRPPEQSYFLFGPRGTGKSVWARGRYRSAVWVDLLEPDVFRTYTSRPERLRARVEAEPRKR